MSAGRRGGCDGSNTCGGGTEGGRQGRRCRVSANVRGEAKMAQDYQEDTTEQRRRIQHRRYGRNIPASL